jgi:hypothetical protein
MSTLARVSSQSRQKPFTKTVQLQVNSIGFAATALVDTGAQAEPIISPEAARRAGKQLGAKTTQLDQPLQLQDYRKQPAGRIAKYMTITLEIDRRRFPNQKFWITETGHDVFIAGTAAWSAGLL